MSKFTFTPIFPDNLTVPENIHQHHSHTDFTLLGGFSCEDAIFFGFLDNQPPKYSWTSFRLLSLAMAVNGVPVHYQMANVKKYQSMLKEFYLYLESMDLRYQKERKGKNPIEGNLHYYMKFPENKNVIIIPFYHMEEMVSIVESFGINKLDIGTIPDENQYDLMTIPINWENILLYKKIVRTCKKWCEENYPEFFI